MGGLRVVHSPHVGLSAYSVYFCFVEFVCATNRDFRKSRVAFEGARASCAKIKAARQTQSTHMARINLVCVTTRRVATTTRDTFAIIVYLYERFG